MMSSQFHSGHADMKFWELTSVMGTERAVLENCLRRPEWATYYDWYMNFDRIVSAQDREKLDAPMPGALVRDVLSGSRQIFYLYDGWLRSRRFTEKDLELPALVAFEKFGGKALEEALERGSFRVQPQTPGA